MRTTTNQDHWIPIPYIMILYFCAIYQINPTGPSDIYTSVSGNYLL